MSTPILCIWDIHPVTGGVKLLIFFLRGGLILLAGGLLLITGVLLISRHAAPQPAWITFAHNSDLYRIRTDGSALKQLTSGYQEEGSHSWSPDGRWIAFTSFRSGTAEIFVMRSNGAEQRRLTLTPQGMSLAPEWSPDGKWLVFASNGEGAWAIYRMRPDGSDLHKITYGDAPAWSPDSQTIAYANFYDMAYQIFRWQAGTEERLTQDLTNSYNSPDWSPNGTTLIFIGSTKGEFPGLYQLKIGAAESVLLQADDTAYYFPAWSPDGRWIAYVAQHIAPGASYYETTLQKMRADGTGRQQLTNLHRNVWSPQWSPIIDLGWRPALTGTGGLILLIFVIIPLSKRRKINS